jgi:RNA polymerase primary sigma factor
VHDPLAAPAPGDGSAIQSDAVLDDRAAAHGRADRRRAGAFRERALVAAAQHGGELERDRLVDRFLPLIASVARGYRSASVDRAELMQEGVVGLLRALERYDGARPTPFWAYASWYVREAMQGLVAELSGPVVLSDRAHRQLARIRTAQQDHVRRLRRDPAPDDLAAQTGLPVDRISSLLAARHASRSLDEVLPGGDGRTTDRGDLLADPVAEDDYDRVLRRLDAERLLGLLDGLSARELTVLRARFGLGERALTLGEVSLRLGVTAERVRQVELQALEKLRAFADARPSG